jgi:hypothetical protein
MTSCRPFVPPAVSGAKVAGFDRSPDKPDVRPIEPRGATCPFAALLPRVRDPRRPAAGVA